MGKTLVRASHRKYKKNAKDGKRTKRGRHVMKKSRRMHSYSRSHKRYTRTRRHMRNKKGGLHSLLQSSLLTEFKNKLYNSTLRDLALKFKQEKDGNLTEDMLRNINNDTIILYIDNVEVRGGLVKFCTKLTEKQIIELLISIKNQSSEGKNFYTYVLLLILAKIGNEAARNLLKKMFQEGSNGLEQSQFTQVMVNELDELEPQIKAVYAVYRGSRYDSPQPSSTILYQDWIDAVQE